MNDGKIVVLASGRGSNLQAILDTCVTGSIPGRVSLVMSDVPGAPALERAHRAGVATQVLNYQSFPSKKAYEEAMLLVLEKENPQILCLAGYMRIVGRGIVERFRDRILNIHPSLLPSFPGLEAQSQALEYGVKIAGCTVHLVDEGVDTGAIILQASCPVEDDDTVEILSGRILQLEHKVYPRAIRLVLEGKAQRNGRKVRIWEAGS